MAGLGHSWTVEKQREMELHAVPCVGDVKLFVFLLTLITALRGTCWKQQHPIRDVKGAMVLLADHSMRKARVSVLVSPFYACHKQAEASFEFCNV